MTGFSGNCPWRPFLIVAKQDTGDKWGYFDKEWLARLGVSVDGHGKMPDVVLYYPERNRLLLIESVTSHGPVDGKRHEELGRFLQHQRQAWSM